MVSAETDGDIDSSLVRERSVPKKNVGQVLLDIPEELLKTPVYIGKGLTWLAVYGVYENPTFSRLFNFNIEFDLGVYPYAAYSSNKGIAGGLTTYKRNIISEGDRFRIKGWYSTQDYQFYGCKYTAPNLFGDDFGVRMIAEYNNRPKENFYGIGSDSRRSDKIAVTLEQTDFRGAVEYTIDKKLSICLQGGYLMSNVFDGKDDEILSDLQEIREQLGLSAAQVAATRLGWFGFEISHDWRDRKGQPTRGGEEYFAMNYYRGVKRSDGAKYNEMKLKLAYYINLFRNRILAVKFVSRRIHKPDDSPDIPFYLLSNIVDADMLRGYMTNRFLDNDMMVATIEYRYPILNALDAFIFLDEGRVFNNIDHDLESKNWRYAAGLGLRLWYVKGVIMRFQVGFTKEDTRFFFQFAEDI